LFDLNRDWFAMTQPETIGKVAVMQEWYPVVVADLHEMGGDRTYFFAPGSDPVNPHLTSAQLQNQELYGRTNARWFDEYGIDYFTRDVYDEFYTGYASWTYFFGATAMTYEQAGVEGLLLRQYDGGELSFAESVRNHFVTSLATAETTASNRQLLLQRFYDFQVSAIDEGRSEEIRAYIIPTQLDQAGANELAGKLVRQGVRVGVADESFAACGVDYEPGSYLIDMAQPAKRLVRTLLDEQVPMGDRFIAEQERRRKIGLGDQIYDVTAWSVPLMMNLTTNTCNRLPAVDVTPAGPELVLSPDLPEMNAKVAYLVPWGERTAIRFLSHALRRGLAVKSSDKPFTLLDTQYPGGTLIIDVADNNADIHQTVRDIATTSGANVIAIEDSWVTAGPSLGGNEVVRHNVPGVAIAWDQPTYPPGAGHARFVIERQFDYPVTAIRTSRIGGADLDDFDVLILPESYRDYAAVLGESGADNLRNWVKNGGVLIGLGTANRYLTDPDIDLLSVRRENATREDDDEDSAAADGDDEHEGKTVDGRNLASVADLEKAIAAQDALPDSAEGALLRSVVSADHWLGAGVASSLNVLTWGSDIYTPIRLDSGTNVARFTGPEDLLAGGHLWEENRKQLAYKPFAVAQPSGRGYVIAFTQDPTVRAYLDGLNVILANAIFRGAAHARPMH
jgi:hypothetical protein